MKIDDGNGHDWLIWAVQDNMKHANSSNQLALDQELNSFPDYGNACADLGCKASSFNQLALFEEFNSLPDLTRQTKPLMLIVLVMLSLVPNFDVLFWSLKKQCFPERKCNIGKKL